MVAWKISDIKKDDVDLLGALTRLIYGHMWKRAGDASYYKWKFFSEFLPRSIGRVAVNENEIVGCQSSFHRRFRFGNSTFWSTELSDAMTHPDCRRQGMWASVARPVVSDALDQGFIPVTGFPNKYAYPGWINKLSMNHFFNLWRLALILQPPPAGVIPAISPVLQNAASSTMTFIRRIWTRIGRGMDPSILVVRNCKVGAWADRLWALEIGRLEAGVVKDKMYLRWRFEENPDVYRIYLAKNREGDPLGFLVTKIREQGGRGRFGFIADMLVPGRDRKVLHRLLLEAEKDFRASGVMLVDVWTTPVPFYLYSLMAFGFLPVARVPFIVPVPQARFLRSKGWGSSRRWLLTMGDSDNI